MAKYNTFVVKETKHSKTLLVTSSARKAKRMLTTGLRIEVWSENVIVETIYTRTIKALDTYTAAEKDYIRRKQAAAEQRNRRARKWK